LFWASLALSDAAVTGGEGTVEGSHYAYQLDKVSGPSAYVCLPP